MKHITPPTGEPIETVEAFAALAVAVPPAWHQAIVRLASASERLSLRLEKFTGTSNDGMAGPCRELIRELIDFLDSLDEDCDLEPSFGGAKHGIANAPGADECEPPGDDEPSLGSFDRMTNQEKCYRQQGGSCGSFSVDAEVDDSDREDDDPDEARDQPPA